MDRLDPRRADVATDWGFDDMTSELLLRVYLDHLFAYRVLERNGGVRVLRQPPEARVGPLTRLGELLESLRPGH